MPKTLSFKEKRPKSPFGKDAESNDRNRKSSKSPGASNSSSRLGLYKEQIIDKELEAIELINKNKFGEALSKLLELNRLAGLSPDDPHSM